MALLKRAISEPMEPIDVDAVKGDGAEAHGEPPEVEALVKAYADLDDAKFLQAIASTENTNANTKDDEEIKSQLKPRDKRMYENLQAAQSTDFDARSPLGQKFSSDLKNDPELKGKFDNVGSSHGAKLAFRKEWTRLKLDTFMQEKVKSKSWRAVDETKGRYLPSDRIAIEEGNAPAAQHRARMYCAKAAKLGGKWCLYNRMTEHLLFLYLEWSHINIFESAWHIYEKESSRGNLTVDPPQSKNPGAGADADEQQVDPESAKKKRGAEKAARTPRSDDDDKKRQKQTQDELKK